MTGPDDEFQKRLLATFREEAREHVTEILDILLMLQRSGTPADPVLVEQIFRNTHSLKGAARAVKKKEIESVCQNLEDIFSRMKKGIYEPDAGAFTIMYRAIRSMQSLLEDERSAIRVSEVIGSIRSLSGTENTTSLSGHSDSKKQVIYQGSSKAARTVGTSRRSSHPSSNLDSLPGSPVYYEPYGYPGAYPTRDAGSVRIASHKLDRLIAGSDDLLTTRLFIAHRRQELAEMRSRFVAWRRNQVLLFSDLHRIRRNISGPGEERVPSDLLLPFQRLMNFIDYDREFIINLEHDLAAHIRATERDGSALESSTTGLTELIHEAVLMPASSILISFPGLVRDYYENTGKLVTFEVIGGEIEIDRRILDALKDPLIHLVYNSIDHGIEYPDLREAAGKPATGRVRIHIQTHAGGRVTIEVTDNGKGIDGAKIRSAALKAGLITKEESIRISDEEAIWLIFRSGFSTNPVVTDISGRGLGLAIVEDTITRLGGHVTIASRINKGTRFTLDVPVRLVTFRGVVVRAGTQCYVLPMQQVQQVLRVKMDALTEKDGRAAISGVNELTNIYTLSELLGEKYQRSLGTGGPICLVILAYGAGQIACSVDEIIRVQEIVVRPLGSQLRRVKRISGGAILGDGTLALVLDPPELIQEAFRRGCPVTHRETVSDQIWQILVAEDSVTSRAYLQTLLEHEGYQVLTATNGREALVKVKAERPDLVISDVDMPLMNGFLLAENIRKDKRFGTLPVILVTSLDSQKDVQQGIGAGVDAYLVKSSFENGVLLETIRTLLSSGRRTCVDSGSSNDSPD